MPKKSVDIPHTLGDEAQEMWGVHHLVATLEKPTPSEQEIARHLYEEKCVRDLLTRYAYFYDGRDLDGVMTVFHDNCRLVNPRGTYVGIEAVRRNYQYLINHPVMRFHYAMNVLVVLDDEATSAWMTAYLYCVSGSPSAWSGLSGSYAMYLEKSEKRWKTKEMRITANIRTDDGQLTPTVTRAPAPTEETTSRDWIGPQWLV